MEGHDGKLAGHLPAASVGLAKRKITAANRRSISL